jgi:crotonobetainyl-CoA:carnitine CoA-transferase CaiB-like acyl-CoA transferase
MVSKPLEGINVLDLTWVYSGPHCTAMLLDMGAEVVKIEGPAYGDHTRLFPPIINGISGYFYMLNRGKKSVALNLKTQKGKELFLELVKNFDVVTENFVPGTMDKLGLSYEEMKRVNPGIIYGSIYGFGSWGPYSSWPGVDPVAQAMGGLMSLTGLPDGPPLKTGPAVADAIAGIYLAAGILAALFERNKTGLGKRIEVSMQDAVFSVLEESVIRSSMTGNSLPARGNTDPLGAPWDAFPTKDGKWIMICSLGGERFYQIYSFIGRKDLAEEYKGDTPEASEKRSANLGMLNQAFAEWSITKNADELMAIMHQFRVPCGVVKDVVELLEDPHLQARNMVVDIQHPQMGAIKTHNSPIMMNGSSCGIAKGENPLEPELGQDNEAVLKQYLDLDSEQIAAFYDEGILWSEKKEG